MSLASRASRAQWTVAAGRGHVRLELLEQLGQAREDIVLDGGARPTQLLPVVALGDGPLALLADGGRRTPKVRAELRVGEGRARAASGNGGGPGERRERLVHGVSRAVRPHHGSPEARICA